MHDIEPFYNWLKYYEPYEDPLSPFYEFEADGHFRHAVYDYVIHPDWDEIGSETLYLKVLMVNYALGYAIIELFGEWNDTLHNDIMYLKRKIIDVMLKNNIEKFILIGENIFQFHGLENDYYEEWIDDCESGWIVVLGFRSFIIDELKKHHLDAYFNYGGTLDISSWRTSKPDQLFAYIELQMKKRLN